jgi:hypothetical protein
MNRFANAGQAWGRPLRFSFFSDDSGKNVGEKAGTIGKWLTS